MTDDIFPKEELLSRPQEIDEGTYLRIKTLRPLDNVVIPLIDKLIELVDYTRKIRPWYLGKVKRIPRELLGPMIDPDSGLGELYTQLAVLAKSFAPGALPGHSDKIRAVTFLSMFLFRELAQNFTHSAVTEATRRMGSFFGSLSDPANSTYPRHDYHQRIDSKLKQMLDALTTVSRLLRDWERQTELSITFSKLPEDPLTKEDVQEIVESATEAVVSATKKTEKKVDTVLEIEQKTAATVKRIDRRAAKDRERKRDKETDRLRGVYAIWEEGQNDTAVKESTNSKVSYADVFQQYREKLLKLGVKHAGAFESDIRKVQKRIYRKHWKS